MFSGVQAGPQNQQDQALEPVRVSNHTALTTPGHAEWLGSDASPGTGDSLLAPASFTPWFPLSLGPFPLIIFLIFLSCDPFSLLSLPFLSLPFPPICFFAGLKA